MKCGVVPGSALAFGWEADVQLFASEHGITIDSKEKYQEVRELMALIKQIDKLTAKHVDIALELGSARQKRDKLKLALGWNRKGE